MEGAEREEAHCRAHGRDLMPPIARARLASAASRAPRGLRLPALPAYCQKSLVQGWTKPRARGTSGRRSEERASLLRVRAKTADDVAPSTPDVFTEDLLRCCEPGASLRVAVLLSGGVDSSVALALLRAAGHQAKAYYLQIWFQEDFANTWAACPWEAELGEASAVCRQLGVPLEPLPLSKEYWSLVVDRCLKGVRRGHTPNPDVLCNSAIKFGAFAEALTSRGESVDRIATGHYARVERRRGLEALTAESDSRRTHETSLHLSADPVKDQTYFLAGLSPQQLALCSFPLGALDKPAVRSLAASLRLPNAARKDSQGLCFLGRVPYAEFLSRHLGSREGPIREWGSGRELGRHRGAWAFTRGQRKGLRLAGGPWYVVQTDVGRSNAVWVSNDYYGPAAAEGRREFACSRLAWLRAGPDSSLPLSCKVRHGPQVHECRLEQTGLGRGRVVLGGSDQGLSPGQYVVFYQGDECLGCGVIEE